jgi:hypothetical protein
MSHPEFDAAYAALLDLFPIDPTDPAALLAVIAEAFEKIR